VSGESAAFGRKLRSQRREDGARGQGEITEGKSKPYLGGKEERRKRRGEKPGCHGGRGYPACSIGGEWDLGKKAEGARGGVKVSPGVAGKDAQVGDKGKENSAEPKTGGDRDKSPRCRRSG